jgi:hypothetical protein
LLPDGTARSAAPQSDDVYTAVRSNDLARVKTLVGSSADANAKDEQGDSPLLYSAAVGSVDAMKYLLDKGSDANVQNGFGSTALMISATDIAKVRLLVEHGADVNRASKQGRTALFIAAMSDQSSEIVRYLVAKGADLKAKDAFGNTILTAAATGNDLNTIRIALDAGGEELQRDHLAELQVVGAVDLPHAAFAEQAHDPVTAGQDRARHESRLRRAGMRRRRNIDGWQRGRRGDREPARTAKAVARWNSAPAIRTTAVGRHAAEPSTHALLVVDSGRLGGVAGMNRFRH